MNETRRIALPAWITLPNLDPVRLTAWAVPFLLTLYLALNNGGYDLTERSEVGVALWWLILIAAAAGLISAPRGVPALAAFSLLLGLAVWTAISLTWTGSEERTAIEIGRVASYLAVLLIAIASPISGRWRALLGGVTAAAALVVALAALSRMLPDLFPQQIAGELLPGVELERRLAYPLNYSSGLAVLAALAVPLLLRASASARLIAVQALAAGLVPVCALVLWLTGSSLAVPLLAVGGFAYLALAPDRLPKLLTLVVTAGGGALLIAAAAQREALDRGLGGAAARAEGEELLAIAIVVIAGVALLQAAISLGVRHGNRPGWSVVGRRRAMQATAAVSALLLVTFALSPAPTALSDAWDEFRDPAAGLDPNEANRSSELLDVSSRGRYDFWQSALDAFETEPLHGIGPGTFEFWWAANKGDRDRTIFVRDAHSLYIENLAELGVVGAALTGSLILLVLAIGAWRALRASASRREAIAAATAGATVFAAAAAVDWVWELAALGVIFFLLAAVALGASEGDEPVHPGRWARLSMAAMAAVGLLAVAIPLGGAAATDRSRDAASQERLGEALSAAADGESLQPYAATPQIQAALVLEERGQYEAAVAAAAAASEKEPKDWRNWITLSRLEARAGNVEESVSAYRRARALNPSSPLFAR